MEFVTAPAGFGSLGLSTAGTILLAILVPLVIASALGLRRDLAVIAACAGAVAAVTSGA